MSDDNSPISPLRARMLEDMALGEFGTERHR